jgi:tRNA-uridine 2-sulfurtransferase
MPTKTLVLYSGGLDSRLAIEILRQQNLQITAIQFILPFGCNACQNIPDPQNIKIVKIDITKNPLLSEYLEMLKNPQHGTGSGVNPCKDCKLFMLNKAHEYANQNNIPIIATGEVLGQRPMSQTSPNLKIINENSPREILRPLSAKALPPTSYETSNLVSRDKLYAITGRGRKEQIKLAQKFDIPYPTPGGGCVLCEKNQIKKLNYLIKNNLITEKTHPLTTIGRHFCIDNSWLVVARNETECNLINKYKSSHIPDKKGSPSVYFQNPKLKQTAIKLQTAYSTGTTTEQRNKFKQFKL